MIFTDKYGHKRRGKIYVCLFCGREFVERLVPAQKTQPRYCSRNCFNRTNRKRIVVICDNCGKQFERVINKLKNSKHGKTFCNRKCKDYAQSFKGNCPDIHPSHYNIDKPYNYREIAFESLLNECADCGIIHKYLLVVHHIDGDRNNNILSNLEIVCPNHHIMRHLKLTDRGWAYSPQHITPRKKLKALVTELTHVADL